MSAFLLRKKESLQFVKVNCKLFCIILGLSAKHAILSLAALDCVFLWYLLQTQSDAVAVGVYADEHDIEDVTDGYDVEGVAEGLAAELRAVNESGGFDADVDKGSEVSDVLHGAAQNSANLKVGEFDDTLSGERRG